LKISQPGAQPDGCTPDLTITLIAADVSKNMLAFAERRLRSRAANMQFQLLDAESMPSIESGSVDAYSTSLALKICDRSLVLQEALRVLRPGGRLIILEASNIRWTMLNKLYLYYMAICMPIVGYVATGGDSSAYRYLLQALPPRTPAQRRSISAISPLSSLG